MNAPWILLYDFLQVRGGAEALSVQLCEGVEQLDLAVAFVERKNFKINPIADERLRELTSSTQVLGWQTLKSLYVFERRCGFIKDYEKVIFSGSSAPVAVKHRAGGGNILYCHTPPRFIYDLKAHYLNTVSLWKKPLLHALIAYVQPKYESAIEQMDLIIANSKNVKQRIAHYLNKRAIVIYPPCNIKAFKWQEQGDFYLSTARVEPYKRVDLIVKAFLNMPNKKLVVASGGSALDELKQLAAGANNIYFTGWCEFNDLKNLMGNCIASLYLPMDEDFGMSPVESMAAGKPVIGVAEGGVKESVIDGVTGVLCPENPSVDDIVDAVCFLGSEKALAMRAHCERRAKLFSADIFIEKMRRLLEASEHDLSKVATEIDADR